MDGGVDMASARIEPLVNIKPKSCVSCHRRKLKCDRQPHGCNNCAKSQIPCLYFRTVVPRTNDGIAHSRRTPRGPYRKNKTPRERELEHVINLIQTNPGSLEHLKDSQATSGKIYEY